MVRGRYRSGSFYHQAKISKNNLYFYFLTFLWLFIFEEWCKSKSTVPSKSNKQNNVGLLKVTGERAGSGSVSPRYRSADQKFGSRTLLLHSGPLRFPHCCCSRFEPETYRVVGIRTSCGKPRFNYATLRDIEYFHIFLSVGLAFFPFWNLQVADQKPWILLLADFFIKIFRVSEIYMSIFLVIKLLAEGCIKNNGYKAAL